MLLFINETAKDKKKLQVNQIQFQNTSREVKGAGSCDFLSGKTFSQPFAPYGLDRCFPESKLEPIITVIK